MQKDTPVEQKQQELNRILIQIEEKMNRLEDKGLSIALYNSSGLAGRLDKINEISVREKAKCRERLP